MSFLSRFAGTACSIGTTSAIAPLRVRRSKRSLAGSLMYTRELQRAAKILRAGGIVAYATEYCFGLGCDPTNRAAVIRLLRLKQRPVKKGLIVLAADMAQLAPYVQHIPSEVAASWPGPHTWLLPAQSEVPGWITGEH